MKVLVSFNFVSLSMYTLIKITPITMFIKITRLKKIGMVVSHFKR